MSLHKFGYSVESLQKDEIENLEKEFESQTKVINIKFNDVSHKLEKFNILQNTELRVEEIQPKCGETNIIIIAKFFLDLNRSIEDIKMNLKYLEQDFKTKLFEKKNGTLF